MKPNEDPVVALCWAIFLIYWVVFAIGAKPVSERHGTWTRSLAFLLAAVIAVNTRFFRGIVLWQYSPPLRVAADAFVVIGMLLCLWARTILGGNWSSSVVLKEQHELIDRGPYRYVRHPIYTGALVMVCGIVILWGRLNGLLTLGISVVGLTIKALREEALLTSHFPDAYPRYRAHVRAMLLPFLI